MSKKKPYDPDAELDDSQIEASTAISNAQIEEMQQKIDTAEQKTAEHWQRILRMQADADNASRRTERDVANAHKYAIEKFVGELIPIIDSLELCLGTESAKSPEMSAMIEGVEMTLKMFYTAMEKFGIQQVNPTGQAFNPEYEQAISVQVDPNVKAGTVLSVLQKGYTLNGRLIRPALVVVSKTEN